LATDFACNHIAQAAQSQPTLVPDPHFSQRTSKPNLVFGITRVLFSTSYELIDFIFMSLEERLRTAIRVVNLETD